jgi:transposase
MSALESASREDLLTLIDLMRRTEVLLKAQIAGLEAQAGGLLAQNTELVAANEALAARVAELERRTSRNSGNSNLPPSSDVFTKPAKPTPVPGGRKRGKQPGGPGAYLLLSDDPGRQIIDHMPQACGGCGAAMSTGTSAGFTRRQVHDIPMASVTVTEHRLHKVRCGCGRLTAAAAPEHVAGSPTSYGPNLRALTVYLLVFQHVPVERAAILIADVTGAAPSTGWVASVLSQAAVAVAESLKLIKALLTLGHVLHVDETTTRIRDKRAWLHVACTDKLTFLALAARSKAGADSLGVLPRFRGTLVHDCLSFYGGYTDVDHQLCASHLIRELTAAEQDHPGQRWHDQVRWALSGLIRQARAARTAGLSQIPHTASGIYLRAYHQGVLVGLRLHPRRPGREQSPARNLLERLHTRSGSVLRFADHPLLVEATNNQGERDLRPVKTQVKISGCHQSQAGAAAWLTVRSYLSSAAKHGTGAFEALRRAFTGDLWMPPIAA